MFAQNIDHNSIMTICAGTIRGCNIVLLVQRVNIMTAETFCVSISSHIQAITILINPINENLSGAGIYITIIVVAVISTACAGSNGSIAVPIDIKGYPFISLTVAVVVKAVTNLRVAGKIVGVIVIAVISAAGAGADGSETVPINVEG